MSKTDIRACPRRLTRLMQDFLLEEAQSALRHAMRNKLAAIRNSVYYVQRKVSTDSAVAQEDPRVPQFLTLIDTELTSCQALLRGRPIVGEPDGQAVADVHQAVSELLTEEPLKGAVKLDAPKPVRVRVDTGELQLALYCLIENAVDAHGGGGEPIEVKVEEREGKVQLSVLDRGPGLSAEARSCLTPFFTSREGRQGLGLNIAQRVATRCGGTLSLDAREGGGTRATLVLPPEGGA